MKYDFIMSSKLLLYYELQFSDFIMSSEELSKLFVQLNTIFK